MQRYKIFSRFANFVTEKVKFFDKNVRIQFLTARVRLFRTQWTKYSDIIRDNKQSLNIGRLNLPEKEERKGAELKSRAVIEDIMRHMDLPRIDAIS